MISWLTSGSEWGTREQAIPGEWAALVLIMVLGALLGLLVLWFTVLRHEQTVRHRASLRPGPDGMVAFAGLGAAADEKGTPTEAGAGAGAELESGLEDADEDAGLEVDAVSGVRGASRVNGADEAGNADEVGESGELDGEPAAGDGDDSDEEVAENDALGGLDGEPAVGGGDEGDGEAAEVAPERSAQRSAASQAGANSSKRKLTDEILSRIECELAGRRTPRWKELAELVHREFGVSVHPSSIQRAVKKRRVAAARGEMGRMGDVGRAADEMAGAGVAESGTEPAAELVVEFVTQSGVEHSSEPVTQSVAESGVEHASEPVTQSAAEPVAQAASEPAAGSVEPWGGAGGGVRPNGGRRATAWSSPACPAGDAG